MKPPIPLPYGSVLVCPAVPASVSLARRTAQMTFTSWGIRPGHPVLDAALLILSELVTNSVRHAVALSPQVTVTYAGGPDTLAFAVHDRHPHQPALHAAAAGSGGLAMIMELTLGLGGTAIIRSDADGRGKSIWITLPL
ncbi:ATP-binding protein [Streptomyces roseoverticillatus]|uniref:ATP-binding protein n=1 Tax=Streptomyces roseoverticillatus TaxID=66429 RepID=UPI0004C05A30|nr:ATP-binding protein [Streptomyces roseoverticillatus]